MGHQKLSTTFWHFDKGKSVLIVEVFHQESVHRCVLGCSAKPILDYVTTGLFAGPLSVNLPDFKKWQISVALIILNFDPQICTKV